MWRAAVTSYQVNKCVQVSRMLSGRFRCGALLRHLHPHISGLCELCRLELEELPHFLIPRCPKLKHRVPSLLRFARETFAPSYIASTIFEEMIQNEDDQKKVQFLLDPSTILEIIAAEQNSPGILEIFLTVTTTWCYAMNRARLKLLGK